MANNPEPAGTVRINPGLWAAAITIVGAIVAMTGAILSRPTTEAVEKAVRSEIAPMQMEMKYLKEAIERMDGGRSREREPQKAPTKADDYAEDFNRWNFAADLSAFEQMNHHRLRNLDY